MLTIENIEVKYKDQIALKINSPIVFKEGDRIGIIGSNGAGKTTLLKSILGIIKYNGSIYTDLKPHQISVHMQSNNYVDTMTIKNIIEAILNTKIKNNTKLMELIHFFDFENCLNKKYKVLSGGQKQRLTIILVLMQDTPLVFFDEVTSGLDFETRQQLTSKMNSWYKDKNNTVCIISHYYEELEQLADKLLILDKGSVVDFDYKEILFEKYCGKSVIIISKNEKNEELTKEFKKILAPEHLIVMSCLSNEDEHNIIDILIKNNINFKRSNNDIEIMHINAKENFNKELV